MKNLTEDLKEEEMSVCPFCEQPLFMEEMVEIFLAHGLLSLAHKDCLED